MFIMTENQMAPVLRMIIIATGAATGLLLIYQLVIDIEQLLSMPISQWIFESIFWNVIIKLAILAACAAILAVTPVGWGMASVGLAVIVLLAMVAAVSYATSYNVTNNDNNAFSIISNPSGS
jgi:hypothetical protein